MNGWRIGWQALRERQAELQDAVNVGLFVFKDTNWARLHAHLATK